MSVQRVTELPTLPSRPADAHKGSFGRVVIAAGSRGMSGAAALAGLGALRGGAGLVYVAVPESILPIVAGIDPSYLTIPLPEDDHGRISKGAGSILLESLQEASAAAIGPGWGQSKKLTSLASKLYSSAECPLVVDADALNALASSSGFSGALAPRILTPHPGEFSRMTGKPIAEIQQNREQFAIDFARENSVVLLLKGHETVITDGEKIAINPTGNPGMATGGSGDVLTGLIAALLAQKMEPFAAAQLGAYLHGLAGDCAAEEVAQHGLIASDLLLYLGDAWLTVEET